MKDYNLKEKKLSIYTFGITHLDVQTRDYAGIIIEDKLFMDITHSAIMNKKKENKKDTIFNKKHAFLHYKKVDNKHIYFIEANSILTNMNKVDIVSCLLQYNPDEVYFYARKNILLIYKKDTK